MRTSPLLTSLFAGGLFFAIGAGCSSSTSTLPELPTASLRVMNQSNFAIVEIHRTTVGNPDFGPNLLAGDVLAPAETLSLGVPCGTYDALLVDESGVDCEVDDIDLCLNEADWIVRDNTCPVFGAR